MSAPSSSAVRSRLVAITAYFNPGRSRRRAFNYRVFRDRLTVPLVTVELADEGAFELAEGDADRLVRVSGGDLIWQKERLLNIALAHLPADCTHVVWLDSDIVFLSDDWPDRLLDALRRWRLVQPFARAFQVAPGWEEGMPLGEHVVAPSPGAAAVIKAHGLDAYVDLVRDGGTLQPVVGYGWAARRDLLDAHGFFDACIIGGGDRAIFSAGQGIFESVMDVHHMNAGQRRRFLAWAEPFHADVRGEVARHADPFALERPKLGNTVGERSGKNRVTGEGLHRDPVKRETERPCPVDQAAGKAVVGGRLNAHKHHDIPAGRESGNTRSPVLL